MRILTLNCGSSSVKYALFDMPERKRLCHGIVDGVGVGRPFIEHHTLGGQKYLRHRDCPTHEAAVRLIVNSLTDKATGAIGDISEIDAVGHRVVHGGDAFTKPAVINDEVLARIKECSALAPLHNPANLTGIRAFKKLGPDIAHVAVFDTAFFTTMPPHVFTYGLPYEWYEKYGVRRYGFHGTSHRYISARAAVLLGRKPEAANLVTLHIGNGVSITAVKGGAAFDHSMGFTPLEGAVMGTRCGDIDPGIPLFIMRREKLGPREMEAVLYKKSGLLGISGRYIDRREMLAAMAAGDGRAGLAFEVECYRLRKYIGAYTAAMGGVDAIVFSGGVGENSFLHRRKVCEGLECLGAGLDHSLNERAVGGQQEVDISLPESRVKIFVIPTDEELLIAEDTHALLAGHHGID